MEIEKLNILLTTIILFVIITIISILCYCLISGCCEEYKSKYKNLDKNINDNITEL